ncbi:CD74 molecule, major histocompatibility complex, class II invariant chain b [Denticeps clupeoides]|uniref:Thyroglobulin type-1 domain-containing protein n=1 Tax=Denticeps clupeoides TaxID=299321 RepID=A0AAY4BAR8_9TELE|nr:HLA class II histocompatibility antigen gamma chain-like [Denticeps clupeoides]
MSESQQLPLLTGPNPSGGGSNKKALKGAALTVLACLLLAGQALTAYMLVGQKSQLNDLGMRMHRLKEISSRSFAPGAPMKMHLPMNSLPLLKLTDDQVEKKPDAAPEAKELTQCQKENLGLSDTRLPSFKPQCDSQGNYMPKQCWGAVDVCWCVDDQGVEIPSTINNPTCENQRATRPATRLLMPAQVNAAVAEPEQ